MLLFQYLHLQLRWYFYSPAFYGYAIYHGQLMPDGPILLYVLCHIFLFVWPAIYDISLQFLQMCIYHCCFLYIMYWCTHWQVHSVAFSIAFTFILWPKVSLSLFSLWYAMISNLQWIAQFLACMVCVPCTDACIELCIAGIVIATPHLCHYSYQWFMVCDDMYFTCKTVVMEILQPMQDSECFSLYIVVLQHSTR